MFIVRIEALVYQLSTNNIIPYLTSLSTIINLLFGQLCNNGRQVQNYWLGRSKGELKRAEYYLRERQQISMFVSAVDNNDTGYDKTE